MEQGKNAKVRVVFTPRQGCLLSDTKSWLKLHGQDTDGSRKYCRLSFSRNSSVNQRELFLGIIYFGQGLYNNNNILL